MNIQEENRTEKALKELSRQESSPSLSSRLI